MILLFIDFTDINKNINYCVYSIFYLQKNVIVSDKQFSHFERHGEHGDSK